MARYEHLPIYKKALWTSRFIWTRSSRRLRRRNLSCRRRCFADCTGLPYSGQSRGPLRVDLGHRTEYQGFEAGPRLVEPRAGHPLPCTGYEAPSATPKDSVRRTRYEVVWTETLRLATVSLRPTPVARFARERTLPCRGSVAARWEVLRETYGPANCYQPSTLTRTIGPPDTEVPVTVILILRRPSRGRSTPIRQRECVKPFRHLCAFARGETREGMSSPRSSSCRSA
jgi:hypothetical protein